MEIATSAGSGITGPEPNADTTQTLALQEPAGLASRARILVIVALDFTQIKETALPSPNSALHQPGGTDLSAQLLETFAPREPMLKVTNASPMNPVKTVSCGIQSILDVFALPD